MEQKTYDQDVVDDEVYSLTAELSVLVKDVHQALPLNDVAAVA